MRRAILGLATAAALTAAVPVHAVLAPAQPTPSPTQSAAQPIGDTAETGSDERIGRRIKGIFNAVPALANVTVGVSEGVVELGGKVLAEEDIRRAEDIASRIQGVVTVENRIERDLSIDETLGNLGGVSGRVSDFIDLLPLIGIAALVGLIIAAVGYLLALLAASWSRKAPASFLSELIGSAIKFAFVIGGIVVALDIIGASALLGAVLGGAGVIGIALGFAMRDTIENYVASIMLSIRQPFRANDWVVIEQYEGLVIRLTSRATILMTLDGNHLRIPNSMVFKAVILNYTRNPQRRFDFDLGIDAEDDANAARRLGVKVLGAMDFVLDDPAPSARVIDVGDSNIVIRFLGWIDQREADWYKARSRAIPAVKAALEDAGFALPEPIYRLRFDAGAPLPLSNVTEAGTPGPARQGSTGPGAGEEPHDVSPQHDIVEMVENERKSGPEAEKDLLDSSRPVE